MSAIALPVGAHSKEAILGMIDKGVFDKFILKDITKATGIGYKELRKAADGSPQ